MRYKRGNYGGVDVKYKKTVYQALAVISQFGINMLVPIFLCSFIGIVIDRKLGTSYVMVILFFVGALAGFRNVFRLAKKIYENDDNSRDTDPVVKKKNEMDKKDK